MADDPVDEAPAPAGEGKGKGTPSFRITRRGLVTAAAGGALLVGWALWPRSYAPGLPATGDESILSAWLKIGRDGTVTIAVPQCELGQGVHSSLPQILAGELGADWRTVGVLPALTNPLFANLVMADAWASDLYPLADDGPVALGRDHLIHELARRHSFMLTDGSSSIRMFEQPLREAGATARALLCQAAARRWNVPVEQCDTKAGMVIAGRHQARFGELAADAARETPPDLPPLRPIPTTGIAGVSLPRLDVPAKVDGSVNFAGDVRLPGMMFAAIRQGPPGDTRLAGLDVDAGMRVPGTLAIVRDDRWVAAVGQTSWSAGRALDAATPRFVTQGKATDSVGIAAALAQAFTHGGTTVSAEGAVGPLLDKAAGTRVLDAEYRVALAVHAGAEPVAAAAHVHDGRAEIWYAAQAPQATREAVARALSLPLARVILYMMPGGAGYGHTLDSDLPVQAALTSRHVGRPISATLSRVQDLTRGPFRPPAIGRITGAIGMDGSLVAWRAHIATPATMREVVARLRCDDALLAAGHGDPLAIAGARPAYAIPNVSVTHHPAAIGVPTGRWRGNSDSFTAFFNECFLDEIIVAAGREPMSYRIAMLADQPRLVRVLQGVAAMSGWDGGQGPGTGGVGMGLACHAMRGSFIAVVVSARTGDQGVEVGRISAMVDCGRIINPDIARQVVEGGLIFGMAQALGAATGFDRGGAIASRLADLSLPRLKGCPDVSVEFIPSDEAPGGLSELGVPAVAPAIANALRAASGVRLRTLPLLTGGE